MSSRDGEYKYFRELEERRKAGGLDPRGEVPISPPPPPAEMSAEARQLRMLAAMLSEAMTEIGSLREAVQQIISLPEPEATLYAQQCLAKWEEEDAKAAEILEEIERKSALGEME